MMAQMEGHRSTSDVDSMSLKNKRVSVRARAKLSWPTETLAKRLASSIAMRIRQRAIMCTRSSW